MFGKALLVSDLKIDVSINGGIDIRMDQASPAVVTCVMDGSRVSKVYADEGIDFLSEGGLLSYDVKAGVEITDLCERRILARKIIEQEQENEAMQIHNKGE